MDYIGQLQRGFFVQKMAMPTEEAMNYDQIEEHKYIIRIQKLLMKEPRFLRTHAHLLTTSLGEMKKKKKLYVKTYIT